MAAFAGTVALCVDRPATEEKIDLTMMKPAVMCLAMCAAAGSAQAQMKWTDKGFANLSGGVQSGSHTVGTNPTFPIYDETAGVATSQKVKGGGLFDVSAGYKVWRNLAVGLGFTSTSSKEGATLTAAIPDPVFFDRPRTVAATVSGLKHSEKAVHIIGTWMIPVTDKIDVGLMLGPTVFTVKQQLPGTLTVAEPGPTVTNVAVTSASKTSAGFNLGVDVTYMVTKRYGGGLLLRFAHGSVSLPGATDKLTVGGAQVGGGVRVRF